MKSIRKEAERAQSAKLRRLGAHGSLKAANKAEHAKRKYAAGGSVSDPMPGVEGSAPKPRLDRPSRGAKGGAGKKGTAVNVVIMQHPPMGAGAPPAGPMPGPAMPPAMAAPHPMPPMAGPPPAPMPAGGPPMRKHGGSVGKFANGGKVKHRAEGGWAGEGDTEDDDYRKRKFDDDVAGVAREMKNSQQRQTNPVDQETLNRMMNAIGNTPMRKRGGKVKRASGGNVVPFESKASKATKDADERKDKELSKPMRAKGGRVMTAGAGSGPGRLEKEEIQKKIGTAAK